MSTRILLVFWAQAVLIKSTFGQCIGCGAIEGRTGPTYDGIGYDDLEWTSPAAVYDKTHVSFSCDGYATPYAYDNGWTTPVIVPIYDGYYSYGCDGYSPYSCDGLGWAGKSLYEGYPKFKFGSSSGGSAFKVTSVSPIRPTGISVVSENNFEGPLTVFGEMPFLAVVSLDGVLPTLGVGAIKHACGNDVFAIDSESMAPSSYAYGPRSYARIGYGIPPCACGLY